MSLHIVYDEGYNVESLGPIWLRYKSVLTHVKNLIVTDSLHIHPPSSEFSVSDSHSAEYLESLKNPDTLCSIFEFESELENAEQLKAIDLSQRLQYSGSLTASDLALRHGFAVNIGGGLHHASRQAGGGFCMYNDITAVTERLLETGKAQRVLIIDLDAHQGNGYEEDLWEECKAGQVCIFDAYEPMIFPFPAGELVKQSIHYFIPYLKDDRGDCFMEYLLQGINKPFEEFQPDFVIYNAGTDTMENDPVTKLGQTAEAIKDRDYVVIETCRRAGIPVMMCLSGGYGEAVPGVIAESLARLADSFS